MGIFVRYAMKLRIPVNFFKQALHILNNLHSDEMLLKHAQGGIIRGKNTDDRKVREMKWYSWVPNPDEPYSTLKEEFENWGIVDDDIEMYLDDKTYDFIIKGRYENKLGQQDFLLEQLAPVLRNTIVEVFGLERLWIIKDGKFYSKPFELKYYDNKVDQINDFEDLTQENLSLAL